MGEVKKKPGVINFVSEPPESSELFKTLDGLLVELRKATPEIRSNALCLFKSLSNLATAEFVTTPGAPVVIVFKPSDCLLDLCLAVRTGKFDNLIVGNEHCFSFVENKLWELPILSILEKLPDKSE